MSIARHFSISAPDASPSRPAPDRSAHPSVHSPSAPNRPVGSLSFRALRTIAAGLSRVEQPLPEEDIGDGARSVRLIATAFYDVWKITWPDGSGLEPHDHGEVRSVIQVIDGEVIEVYSDASVREEVAVRTLKRGTVTIAEPTLVHSLSNRSGREATTLHVYSPPLIDVTFFDLHQSSEPEPGRWNPVNGTPAQVTPADTTESDRAPLALVRPRR